MMGNQKWINLSKKEFENQKYENNGKTTGYFKMATGLWFSLPTGDEYVSEWGEFIKNDSGELKERVIDEEGNTNITTVQLRNTSYIVYLVKWKQTIMEVLKNTPYELSGDKKRKILIETIREKVGDKNIEHLIFNIKEDEFHDIKELYYNQEGEKIKRQKSARDLMSVEDALFDRMDIYELFEDFEKFKNKVLLKIELLEVLKTLDNAKNVKYEELEKYFGDDDRIRVEDYKVEAKFNKKEENKDELLQEIIEYNDRVYGQFSLEMLENFRNFIVDIQSLNDYKDKIPQTVARNAEITWLVDYFSGCVNQKYIQGYDMPSLVVFDTDCVEVIAQSKEKIFESRIKERELTLSSEQIGGELGEISREGLINEVQSDLISMIEEKNETKEREQ